MIDYEDLVGKEFYAIDNKIAKLKIKVVEYIGIRDLSYWTYRSNFDKFTDHLKDHSYQCKVLLMESSSDEEGMYFKITRTELQEEWVLKTPITEILYE